MPQTTKIRPLFFQPLAFYDINPQQSFSTTACSIVSLSLSTREYPVCLVGFGHKPNFVSVHCRRREPNLLFKGLQILLLIPSVSYIQEKTSIYEVIHQHFYATVSLRIVVRRDPCPSLLIVCQFIPIASNSWRRSIDKQA